ncbi:MAG: mannose-1-phosphate guanylyltransferase [Saprospiraceae bacterium]
MNSTQNNIYVTIMAGGVGSRFWPASRNARPKQFLDMLGLGKSLLRLTFERFLKVCPAEQIYVMTNQQYRAQVLEHLPELKGHQILCEPSRNNTAPCIAYAALKLKKTNPNATMIVAPSDHLITDETTFVAKIQQAAKFASEQQALVTLGIQPHQAHTGYGYIKYQAAAAAPGVHRVDAFTEKPDKATAESFLQEGNYLWNGGIFIWQAATVLEAYIQYANSIYEVLYAGWDQYNTSKEQSFINEAYPKTESISVDYAIMENADNVYTIPADFGWSDLGTWDSIYQIQEKDEAQNVVSQCNALLQDTSGCLIHADPKKMIVVKGLDDYIIVDDKDVLMIFPKAEEQSIKAITKAVKDQGKAQYL